MKRIETPQAESRLGGDMGTGGGLVKTRVYKRVYLSQPGNSHGRKQFTEPVSTGVVYIIQQMFTSVLPDPNRQSQA